MNRAPGNTVRDAQTKTVRFGLAPTRNWSMTTAVNDWVSNVMSHNLTSTQITKRLSQFLQVVAEIPRDEFKLFINASDGSNASIIASYLGLHEIETSPSHISSIASYIDIRLTERVKVMLKELQNGLTKLMNQRETLREQRLARNIKEENLKALKEKCTKLAIDLNTEFEEARDFRKIIRGYTSHAEQIATFEISGPLHFRANVLNTCYLIRENLEAVDGELSDNLAEKFQLPPEKSQDVAQPRSTSQCFVFMCHYSSLLQSTTKVLEKTANVLYTRFNFDEHIKHASISMARHVATLANTILDMVNAVEKLYLNESSELAQVNKDLENCDANLATFANWKDQNADTLENLKNWQQMMEYQFLDLEHTGLEFPLVSLD